MAIRNLFPALNAARKAFTRTLNAQPAAPAAADEPLPVQPTSEEIENAIAEMDAARKMVNEGERRKAAAKKILDLLPAGIYGPWSISRVPSKQTSLDRAEITARYAALGESVPTKPYADTLKITALESASV